MLTASGEVQIISAAAGNLLDRYFDEKLNSHQLPDALKIWVEQQLRLQQSELIASSQPWQIEKNGRKLRIDLLCDFAAEQHWLICCDRFSKGEAIARANASLPPTIESLSLQHFQSIGLSKREAEILVLVAVGKTNLQISQQLAISIKTVKKHLEHIFSKLKANSRIDAVNKALQQL